jgi:hypothetical protein
MDTNALNRAGELVDAHDYDLKTQVRWHGEVMKCMHHTLREVARELKRLDGRGRPGSRPLYHLADHLDHNCLIDVEEYRHPHVESVLQLRRLANAGAVELSIPASAASERRGGKPRITNFAQFQRWVADLGFQNVDFLAPILYLDFSFLDYAVLAGGPGSALEQDSRCRSAELAVSRPGSGPGG